MLQKAKVWGGEVEPCKMKTVAYIKSAIPDELIISKNVIKIEYKICVTAIHQKRI